MADDPADNPDPDGWYQEDGIWYYADAAAEWRLIDDSWYYFLENGAMATGWVKPGTVWYYLMPSGRMVTGWQYIDEDWYFFSDSGAMYSAAWLKWKDKWYFLHGSGQMAVGWHLLYGKWYYFEDSGAMATGWRLLDGTWYFLRSSGEMATGWEKVDGKWYYLHPSGAMATGWVEDGGKWYYCSSSGAMQTGWLFRNGIWYYLTGSGEMVTHWYRVGGKWYFFDNNGAMQGGHVDVSGYDNPTDRFLYSTTDIDSMIFVIGDGIPGHSAKICYYENTDGVWERLLSDDAWYGYNGFSDSTYEGDATTPVGCFELGIAFGNKSNPGTSVEWVDVNEHLYWVDDITSRYYNRLIDDREVPDGWNSGEHLISYGAGYAYAVNIEVNPPYTTSAIFLHCNGGGTFTHGCVGTSEESMIWILKHLKEDTRIIIVDEETDLDDLNAEGYW